MGYGEPDATDDPAVSYIIIVPQDFIYCLQPLADYKNQWGLVTELVILEDIFQNYTGVDVPDQIRNCIIDYYQNYGIDYVLLAGDDEYIFHRGLYASSPGVDNDIAADVYFAGLDGNWNEDGDSHWGEPEEADLLAEVFVGRAAVDTPTEAANFVNKQILYQSDPVLGGLETGLMVGEDLGWTVWGSEIKDEIRLGSSSAGYTTVGFPPNFEVNTLYDVPGWSFSGMGNLMPLLNQGPNLVNHMGHANVTYMMKFNSSQINNGNCLNNGIDENFYIVYSQGCYCGSFDNRWPSGSVGSDCITEKFSTIGNGAVAMITNSRYGWGSGSSTNGPSQYYDRQFFDALFGEDISKIGWTNQDSKEDNIVYINSATYWCYYQLNLFGDPSLDIWTAEPSVMSPIFAPFIGIGMSTYDVELPGTAGALCALVSGNELLGSAHTNTMGQATIVLDEPITTIIPLELRITAHNYFPFVYEIIVTNLNYPYVMSEFNMVNDYVTGDGDETLDLGEIAHLVFIFTNVGNSAAEDVIAVMSTEDEYLGILDDTVELGDMESGASIGLNAFLVQAASDVPDGYEAGFIVELHDAVDSTWTQNFSLEISAPVLSICDVQVFDYENGSLSPGETADIALFLANTGSGEARELEAVIMTDNPHITINTASANAALIEPGSPVQLEPMFNLTIVEDCPEYSIIPIYVDVVDVLGYSPGFIFEIMVGGFFDNMEYGTGDWTHESVTPGYIDQWSMTDYRNHTAGGNTSWHCGDQSGGQYSNSVDAGLVTPAIDLPPNAILEFWHWMDAEVVMGSPGDAYDGGLVEISVNGGGFTAIEPAGGYPYQIVNRPTSGPFATGAPVYSGLCIDWQNAIFDLSDFADESVRFRFRFGSDHTGVSEGWYIDDVRIVWEAEVLPPIDLIGYISGHTVLLNWNSPQSGSIDGKDFSRGSESLLSYNVYRNGELIAGNICALTFQENIEGFPSGTYAYQVSALFSQGESPLSDPYEIEYQGLYDNPYTSVNGEGNLAPEEFFINRNYPNPFNPETKFDYGLPENGHVELVVYNLLGRTVAVLVDEYKSAGMYSIAWNADNLPTGIYLYYMKAGDFSAKGKMLLLK